MITASLDQASNRYELLVQSITHHAIYMLDPAGTVISWNAGARRFKGYEADEILGQHFSRFYSTEDRAANIPAIALDTAKTQGRFEAEGWRIRKDGTRFWASVVIDPIRCEDGTLLGFSKITRDLTERRAAQEALRASEERFRLLVQSVTDYAIYMLDPEGIVTSWNVGAQRSKGYSAEEIIGQHFSRFYGDDDRLAGRPAHVLATAQADGRFESEGWRVRKDGTRFWANSVIDAVRGDDGTLIGFAKITRDLTERREAERVLEEAREAIIQTQKMEAIGKLTGGVAHDFNNLLAVIMGSLDLARQRLASGGDISRYIDNAMTAADRGATLTQRMLAFARKQDLHLQPVDCAMLVQGMADVLRTTLGGAIAIDTHFSPSMRKAHADPAKLELALLNLAVNARDALAKGGHIRIDAAEVEIGRDERPDLDGGTYIRLSVHDDGEGMDAETLERAREPFFTTKGVGKGTGLGLSMVHGFVHQCGGSLTIASAPGEGTSVTMWLRIAQEGNDAPLVAVANDQPTEDRPLVILAVDDDDLVLTNTAGMLEHLGHTVFQTSSARDALRMLETSDVDLVVTDHAMPGMTGAQLADAIDALRPGLPVIIITGFAELPPHATRRPRLDKPFRQADLAYAVAAVTAATRTVRADEVAGAPGIPG